MADNMDMTSLVNLASVKGSATREAEGSRFRTSSGSASATRGKGGFDGFLKTFLGDDKAGGSSKRMGLSRGRNASGSGVESLASQLPSSSANRSGKGQGSGKVDSQEPVESIEDTQEEDAAVAAREAAQRIWELLYGVSNGGSLDASNLSADAGDPMGQIAGAIASQTGLEAGVANGLTTEELNVRSMPDTLDLTNQSAQANSAAVLVEAEGVIAGMSGEELDAMLAEAVASKENTPADFESSEAELFNRMAEELDVEVVSVGGNEADLLASLANGAAYSGASALTDKTAENSSLVGNVPGAAEISGTFDESQNAVEEWNELFQEFVEETQGQDSALLSDAASAEKGNELVENFGKWLNEKGKVNEAKQLAENPNKFIQSLVNGLSSSSEKGSGDSTISGEKNSIFTQAKNNLESLLHNTTGGKTNEAETLPSGEMARKLNQGIFDDVVEPGIGGISGQNHNGHGIAHGHHSQNPIPSLARTDSTNPAAMSTMMDQIENVERVAEAMKMASKNGGVKNLTVQLTPDELGKVILRVESRDGVVNAYLRVEKPEAVAQLGSNLAQLRENLKQAGVELGEVTIEQRNQNETLGDFSGQRRGDSETNDQKSRIHWRRDAVEKSPAPTDPEKRPAGAGGLNLVA